MKTLLILFGLGGTEIILIAFVVLVLFGSSRIPKLMKGFGKGYRKMTKEFEGVQEEIDTIKSEIKVNTRTDPASTTEPEDKPDNPEKDQSSPN